MLKTRDSLLRQSTTSELRKVPSISCYSSTEILSRSRTSVILSPTGSTPKNMFLINRRLTKGYSKFLEEKDFIDTREEDRAKIEEDVNKNLATENPKVISKEIKKLITSIILNDPGHRPKSVLKVVDNNSSVNIDEKHKHIASRILGGNFESQLLFSKVQEGATIQTQTKQKSKKKEKEGQAKAKGTSVSILKRCTEQFFPVKVRKVDRQSVVESLSLSTISSIKEKGDKEGNGNGLIINGLREKAQSFSNLGLEPHKKLLIEPVSSLNEIDSNVQTRCVSRMGNKQSDSKDTTQIKKITIKRKKSNSDAKKETAFNANLKVRLTLRRKSHQNELTNTHFFNKRTNSFQQPKNSSSFKFITAAAAGEDIGSESLVEQAESRYVEARERESIERINQLCHGAMRSNSVLGMKLKKQKERIAKEFSRLDTEMERLSYQNNLKNWEQSVKQVERIEHESPFFNLVL